MDTAQIVQQAKSLQEMIDGKDFMGEPKRLYTADMDVLNDLLHDMVDRWGYSGIKSYLEGWLQSKGKTI